MRSRGSGFATGRIPVAATAVLGVAMALVVLLVPSARFHIVSPATSPVLIAGCGAAALYVAFVAGRRFARGGASLDLGVAVAFGLIGLADVVFVLERSTLAPEASTAAELLPYHVTSAVVLAACTVVRVPALVRRTPGISIAAAVATLALTLLLLRDAGALSAAGMGAPGIAETTGWRLATCAALLVATAMLLARSAVRRDPLMRWVAVATLLLAGAQTARIAEPVPGLTTVTWAHAFYAAAMLALLMGAVAERRTALREVADLAVADERRRVARDIHDGPAQDLAFVATQSRHLARDVGGPSAARDRCGRRACARRLARGRRGAHAGSRSATAAGARASGPRVPRRAGACA